MENNRNQTIRINLPQAHSNKQRLIMQAFLTPGLREIFVACGTKYGKSLAASACLSSAALLKQNAVWRWLAPIYKQAEIGMDYFHNILPPMPYSKTNKAEMKIHLPDLNSRIEFWHTSDPKSLEGQGPQGNVHDEAAKQPYDAYISARTTLSFTRGPSLFVSTPFGKNWYYKKCMEAKEEMAWAIRNGKTPERIFIHAPTTDNPFISPEVVEAARRELPSRLFKQHYLAEFLDDGSVMGAYKNCIEGDPLFFNNDDYSWFSPDCGKDTQIVIGADWAKTIDFTVFIAFDIVTRRMVAFQRFNRTPYTEAIRRLVLFSRKCGDVLTVKHDKTGLGQAIDDQLAYTDLPYEGVTFTNARKAEMVSSLITSIELANITLPDWPDMKKEFESFEVKTNDIGTMTYSAVEGAHDDIVCAIMLAHTALLNYTESSLDMSYLDLSGKTKGKTNADESRIISPVEQFYADLIDDNEIDD